MLASCVQGAVVSTSSCGDTGKHLQSIHIYNVEGTMQCRCEVLVLITDHPCWV